MKRSDPVKRLENEIQIDRSSGYTNYIKGISNSSKECFNRSAYPNMSEYIIKPQEIISDKHTAKIEGDSIG